jgi:hypothetical protein
MRNTIVVVAGVVLLVISGYFYGKVFSSSHNPSDVNRDGAVNLQDVSIVMSNIPDTGETTISAPIQ